MKKVVLTIFTLMTSTVTLADYAGKDAAIGEIRTSILKPSDFMSLYGPDWNLLSPRDVSNLPIAQFLDVSLRDQHGKYILPDARGKFLRMANNSAAGKNFDPENRILGSFQNQDIMSHTYRDFSVKQKKRQTFASPPPALHEYPGSDNRPKNIAVNFYIRIDCKTGGKCQP